MLGDSLLPPTTPPPRPCVVLTGTTPAGPKAMSAPAGGVGGGSGDRKGRDGSSGGATIPSTSSSSSIGAHGVALPVPGGQNTDTGTAFVVLRGGIACLGARPPFPPLGALPRCSRRSPPVGALAQHRAVYISHHLIQTILSVARIWGGLGPPKSAFRAGAVSRQRGRSGPRKEPAMVMAIAAATSVL